MSSLSGMVAPMPKKPRHHLQPDDPITVLADWSLTETLTRAELLVYIRLLRAVDDQRDHRVVVFNSLLHKNARTAAIALRTLENFKLIKTTFDKDRRRVIEVLL